VTAPAADTSAVEIFRVLLVIAALGCAASAWTCWLLRGPLRARGWRRAQALVQEAWVDQVGAVTAGSWRAGVRFTFTAADGREYRGNRLSFGGSAHRRRAAAEAQVAPLQPGRRVEVWYDPADPTRSVIDRQLHLPRVAVAAVGVLLAIIAVGPLVRAALVE